MKRDKSFKTLLWFAAAIGALLVSMFIAITYGAKQLSLHTVWTAIVYYNPNDTAHQIVHELRLPRVLGAVLTGGAFAVAGALMQGITRNPMADTGILGVNAGASFVVACCFAWMPGIAYGPLMIVSFVGAALSAGFIALLGSATPGGLTSLKLTVAGAVVASILHALSSGVAIYYDLSQDLAFWYAGGLAGVRWSI